MGGPDDGAALSFSGRSNCMSWKEGFIWGCLSSMDLKNFPMFVFSKPACSCLIFQYSGLLLLSHYMLTACSTAEYSAISAGSILLSSLAFVQTYCGIPHPSKNLFWSGIPLRQEPHFLKCFYDTLGLVQFAFSMLEYMLHALGGSAVGWRSRPTSGVGSRS